MTETRKILCIDDDLVLLNLISKFLSRRGYTVYTAGDGEEGLRIFHQRQPDLVLVDLKMPKVNGFEVLETITTQSPDTPVIVISGEGDMTDVIKALRMGAWNYHIKPVETLAIIHHAIEQALEKSRLQRENKSYQMGLEIKLQAIVENFDGFIFTCDNQCRITYANPALRHFAQKELSGQSCCEIGLFDQGSKCPWCIDGLVFTDQPERYEFQSRGDGHWYEGVHIVVADRKGEVEQRQILLQDITARKQAMLDLEEREEYLRKENKRLRATMSGHYRFGNIIGKSDVMQEVYETIINAAASDSSVIIYGESGTGKELVAKAIHEHSDRNEKQMIYVNCGAIPENLIESEFFGYVKGAFSGANKDKHGFLDIADGSSLFLDEVGEIPLGLQVKLLRAIEGNGYSPVGSTEVKKPNVRIIAATNRNLLEAVRQGTMRQDFLYRIHIVPIYLPPLRERREDIRLLVEHFLSQYDPDKLPPLTAKIRTALQNYDWPGNVRELQNTINRFVTLKKLDFMGLDMESDNDEVQSEFNPASDESLDEILAKIEKKVLANALQQHLWHKGNTAKALQIDPKTLYRKMKQYGLKGE